MGENELKDGDLGQEAELETDELHDQDQDDDQDQDQDDDSTPGEKSGFQKRVDSLTARRKKAEEKAAYWRGVAETAISLGKEKGVDADVAKAEAEVELDPNDFDSHEDYLKTVAKRIEEKIENKYTMKQKMESEKAKSEAILSSAKEARKKYPDFDQVALSQNHPVTQEMFEAATGDYLGEILYYLGKNPDKAKSIAAMSPIQQAKSIGVIETIVKSPKKKVSNAPNPPPTVNARGGGASQKKDSEKSRHELRQEWEAARRKKLGLA